MLFLVLIYINFISLGLPDVLLGTAWPDMHLTFAVGIDAAGPVNMVISGMTILSGLMAGALLKRLGTGRLVAFSTLLTALAMLGFALAPTYMWLLVLAVPFGLGAGAIDAAINDYVAAHYSTRHMNWLHAMWGLGAMLGPVLISIAIASGGWRSGYIWVAGIQLVLTLVMLFAIPMWDRHAGGAQTPQEKAAVPSSTLLEAIRTPGVPLSMLAFIAYCSAESSLGLWGASYLTQLRGMDTAAAAMWVSVYFGGITAGRFLSGFISARVSSQSLLRIGAASALVGAVLIALPLPPAVCAVGMLLFGLGLAPLFPTMLHLTPQRFGGTHAARIIGLQISSAYIGSTFVPPIIGWVASATGLGILPYCLVAFMTLELICGTWIDARAKRV